jgi:AGCS family alanine or glycine:cation symporter
MSLLDLSNFVLFASCLFILFGSIFISFKTRFIQLRLFPELFKMLKDSLLRDKNEECAHTVLPHKALFTAMSTTLGISTIVAPVIAINLGGPGALIGFLLTALFGSSATFIEVNLSITHRQKTSTGKIMGGPMQYLSSILSKKMAKWYAISCLILMTVWSGAQANQLAAILDSPLLGSYRMPVHLSGMLLVALVAITLLGGIKRIGSLSSRLVPLMFTLYLGSCLWIIFSNLNKMDTIFTMIFQSFLSKEPLASGIVIGGIVSALRWGVFKGIQTTEAGIGTQSIPHCLAKTENARSQAALAMLSTYTAGIVAFLSGIVALITQTWQDPNLPLGINMVAASFEMYFSSIGIIIITLSALLFGFGTILGNSFNAGQCYSYLTQNKKNSYFIVIVSLMIYLGAILETKMVWSLVDFVLAAMALPHMTALLIYTRKEKNIGYVHSTNE